MDQAIVLNVIYILHYVAMYTKSNFMHKCLNLCTQNLLLCTSVKIFIHTIKIYV